MPIAIPEASQEQPPASTTLIWQKRWEAVLSSHSGAPSPAPQPPGACLNPRPGIFWKCYKAFLFGQVFTRQVTYWSVVWGICSTTYYFILIFLSVLLMPLIFIVSCLKPLLGRAVYKPNKCINPPKTTSFPCSMDWQGSGVGWCCQ